MTNPDKTKNRILAIDPGTRKAGLAVLESDGTVLTRLIIRDISAFDSIVRESIERFHPGVIAIGNGTGHEEARMKIESIVHDTSIIKIIDEKGSTEEARRNYFAQFSLLKRIIVTVGYILGAVKIEVDDEVAVIIGKRSLR